MLTLSKTEISIFKSLIGSGISYCSSDQLIIYPSHAISFDRILMLGFKNKTNYLSILFKADFFENRDSFTFYDYSITDQNYSGSYDNAKLMLETSPIQKIVIYGREIDWNNFDNTHLIREHKRAEQTDDLFHFHCSNEQLLLVFHPFFPQVQLIYGLSEIREFFDTYSHSYKIHYEFGTM